MRKLTTKEIVLLVALIFIVSGALYYNYFFSPYQEKMIDLEAEIKTNNQRLLTLNNEQQSIIIDTEKLQNELAGIQDDLNNIPTGIDEPMMLVFIEETLTGLAAESSVVFSPETVQNEYYQTSEIKLTFMSTYPNLKTILDGFENAPFRNRIVNINMSYEETAATLGPTVLAADDATTEDAETQEEETIEYYLSVELTINCYTISGTVTNTDYDFMIGPYNNTNPFESTEETEE
jgi:hypothetical protein